MHSKLSANLLLDRKPDQDYLEEWALLVQKEKNDDTGFKEISVVVFRLNEEWFALNTSLFAEVAIHRKCHPIPHLSSPFLLGFVNLRGQIFVCVSLHQMLSLVDQPMLQTDQKYEQVQRLLALKKDEVKFTFIAEEVFGVCRFNHSILQPPPVTVAKSKDNYIKGIFRWKDFYVGLLDEALIFQNLQRKICEQR